jgi:putative nucleotidyltransferase with HDIG domain
LEDQVIAWLAQQEVEAYLVGGCVRDRLLGRPVYDLDLTVDGDGLRLARRLANHFEGAYYPLDVARSTGRAILRAEAGRRLVVDVARFRGDSLTEDGSAELTADLADRDFTVNALAADVRAPDVVIDHHGGLDDLRVRLLRPVSESAIRNDPLRALRAFRQAAQLGFRLAPKTERLIRRDGAGLARVSAERVRDELARLLALPHAAPHLRHMDDLGLLTIVLPELEPLRDLAQPPPHHLPVLAHSLKTVEHLEILQSKLRTESGNQESGIGNRVPGIREPDTRHPIPDTRHLDSLHPFAERLHAHLAEPLGGERPRLVTLKLAALLHDTGKPATRRVQEERIRFLGHEKESAKLTGAALRRLRFNRAEVRTGQTIVRHHMRPLLLADQERVSSRAVYRFFRDTDDAGVDVLLHALADHRATYAPDAEDDRWPRLVALAARMLADYYERAEERVAPPPLLDGYDLLREFGLEPGPQIGELLEAVREAQVSGEVRTRDEALALVRKRLDTESQHEV